MPHRHARRDDDDFDDDRPHRPRKRPHGKPKRKGTPVALVVGLVVGGTLLLGGGALAAILLLRDRSTGTAAAQDPFPGMLAHWSFDDYQIDDARQVINVKDSTGRGNNGVITGGRLAPGKKGNALWLDGRDDQYMDVSAAKELTFAPGSELTIAAWFQTRDKFGGTIVAFRHPTLPTQLDIYSRDNRVIGIVGDDDDEEGRHAFKWDPSPTASDGQWHHVALTRRGKTVQLFYDGVSQGEDLQGNSGGRLSGGLGAVGCNLRFVKDDEHRFGRAGFKGAIDEVYVFSRALTGPEIQQLMRR